MKTLKFDMYLKFSKRIISMILPPFLISFMRLIRKNNSKTYLTFQDALFDCQNLGYLDSKIVNHVKSKTQKLVSESFENYELSESDLRILLMAFRASQRGSLKVLDFGGAAGYHYFLFKKW